MLKQASGARVELEAPTLGTLVRDASLNDQDKEFTVPAGKEWEVSAIYVVYIAQGAAGNRQLEFSLDDGASNQLVFLAGAVQPVGTTYNYALAPGLEISALVGTTMTGPLPRPCRLPAGWRFQVRQVGSGDAGDDMTVVIMGAERSAGAGI